MFFSYSLLSTCALGDHTARPLLLFRVLNWRPERSAVSAITPPNTSISLTIWPFARPPIAGLQDILAIAFLSMVTIATEAPKKLDISAASTPE